MQVGDFVKGLPGSPYSITTEDMTRGVVTSVYGDRMSVKVLDHAKDMRGTFDVDKQYFEVIGHVKPFVRKDVMELLKSGCKKALLDYDLHRANLSRADLDFSCFPLWCGGLHIKTDVRLAAQVAYHLCTMQCDDAEYIAMRNSILEFANKFHRVTECGILTPVDGGGKNVKTL